jgi:hypothetical protein
MATALHLQAQTAFTPGNLVVERVGNGSTALGSGAFPVNLVELNTSGGAVQTIPFNNSATLTTPPNLTVAGSSLQDGFMTLSTDGSYLVVPGYNLTTGTASAGSAAGNNRVIGRGSNAGSTSIPVSNAAILTGNNFRGVCSDGTNYWGAGAAGQVYITTAGSVNSTAFSSTTNSRAISIFNGQLFYSTGSLTTGVYSIGSGLPTNNSAIAGTLVIDNGASATNSPNQFAFNPTHDICYVADNGSFTNNGGIRKYTRSGSTWSLAYVLNKGTSTTTPAVGLVVDWSGTNPVIYFTNATSPGTSIFKITDNGSALSSTNTSGTAPTSLNTAGTNLRYAGIAFAPGTPSIMLSGPTSVAPYALTADSYTLASGPIATATSSFVVNGRFLSTNNITVQAPTNFQVSTSASSGFASSVTLTPTSGSVTNQTIFVRLAGSLSAATYNGYVTVKANGCPQWGAVYMTGIVTTPSPAINTPSPSSLSGFSTNAGTASTSQTFTIQTNAFFDGANLTASVTSGQYEISLSSGSGYGSSVTISQAAAIAGPTTIYVRIPSTATAQISNAGVLTFSGGTAPNVTMNLSGIVINATTTPSSLTGFSTNQGTASANQTFSLAAAALSPASGNLTITAPSGFEVSLDNVTYASTRTQAYTSSALSATTVYVRIAATATAGAQSGNVTITGGGLTTRNVAVSGSASGLSLTGTPYKFFSHTGYGSEVQTLSVSGVALSPGSTVTVGPLSGYKFGTSSGSVNANSVSLFTDFVTGDLAATNVFVRLDPANTAGNYNGNITATQGTSTATLAVTGTTFAAPQPFGASNFVVARVGDGSTALSNFSTETFLDEYSFTTPSTFTLVQSVPLTLATNSFASGNKPFTLSGSATSDGYLNLSPDRKYLTMAGYAATPRSVSGVSSTASATINRVVANITYDGTMATSTLINDGFGGNNVRSAVTLDSTGYWVSGAGSGTGGLRYVSAGSAGTSTLVANVGSNNGRVANISNSVLYVSSQSGSNIGINRIIDGSTNTGLFTNSGNTAQVVSGLSSSTVPNAYNFIFLDRDASIAGNDLLYISDNSNGLLKFSFDGTTWTARGSYAGFLQGVTASVNASNQVEIFATGAAATATLATTLYRIVDATAYNANLASSGVAIGSAPGVVTLSAGSNKGFKGVAFTPIQNPKPTVAHTFTNTSNTTMPQGSTLNALARVQLDVTLGNALLTGVSCTTGGTYVAADVTAFKLYASDDNVLDGTDALLATVSTIPASGSVLNFTSLAYNIPVSTPDPTVANTKYIFVAAEMSGCAVLSNTMSVNFSTGLGNFTYTSADKIGASSFGAQSKSVVVGTPSDVTNLAATSGIPTIPVSWTLPACYDAVIVVAHTAPITGTPSGTSYTFNNNYSLATNNFPGGGRVVYQGTGNNMSISGLTLLTNYQIKVFVRISSAWSSGVSGNATTDEFTFYSQSSGDLNSGAIWAYSPTGTPQTAAALGGFQSTRNIRIQPGHVVSVSTSPIACNDLRVEAGGKLYRNSNSVGNMVYFNMVGDLIVNGEIGNGSTFDAIGINCEGSTGALANNITGSGTINLGRIRKSATTNATTEVNVNADVNVRFFGGAGSAAIYNNADNTKLNITIAAGKTLTQTDATGCISIDGTDGTATGLRSGSYTVNGNLVVNGKLYAVHNNNNAAYIPSIAINTGATFFVNDMDYSNATGNNSFTFSNSGTITLKGNLNIVAGSMAAGNSFTLQSNASSTGMITGTGNLTGTATIQRYVPNPTSYDQYHYLSNPTANNLTVSQNLGDDFYVYGSPANYVYSPSPYIAQPTLFPNTWWFNDASVNFSYDGSNPASTGWTNAINTAMGAGQGFACKVPALIYDMDYTGTVNNGSLTTPVIKADDGFNLVGNPYPSPLSWNSFIAANSTTLQNNLILWNPTGNNYAQFSSGVWVNNSGAGTNDKIALGQAFFVVANASGNASFTNAMRSSTQAYAFFEAPNKDLRLLVSNGNSSDETVIQEIDHAANEFADDDASKYAAGMENRCLLASISDNAALAINRMRSISRETEIPLQVVAQAAGSMRFTATQLDGFEGLTPMIYDAVTNSYHLLSKGQAVELQVSAGNNGSRFSVVFQRKSAQLIAASTMASEMQVSANGVQFSRNVNNVRVTDAAGNLVMSRSLINANEGISLVNLSNGVYMLNYEVAGEVRTVKVPLMR